MLVISVLAAATISGPVTGSAHNPRCDDAALTELATNIVSAANRGDGEAFAALVSDEVEWSIRTADTWIVPADPERHLNRYVEPPGDARDELLKWFGEQGFSHAIATRAMHMFCYSEGREFELEFSSEGGTATTRPSPSVVLAFQFEDSKLVELRGTALRSQTYELDR